MGMTIMHDKLAILHKFLNEITHVENEDELTGLVEAYKDKLDIASEEDVMYTLFQDAGMLGSEILSLRLSRTDILWNRKLSALTAEEKNELAEVEAIIDENRFFYHFQPIVSTLDGEIYSYEALMRPISDMDLTPPIILKYAEMLGRLYDIEQATFLNVLEIVDSNKTKFRDRRVFINSIPKIKHSGSGFRRVGELLIKHSDTAVVELTEQSESDDDELNTFKERYRNMGIQTAIDDYGTGYSNVQNLLRYMPNYVKIDHSLISDINNNPKKQHFVREIIEFCHSTGIMALAEGVENSEELHTVILLGIDLIQGFYTARPDAEILESIPYEIKQEIKIYQQERQDGRDQQIYAAKTGERILLDKLIKDDYKHILVEKSDAENDEITIIGLPSLDTEVHIEAAKDFKGRIILENAHLSNIKNRPCINLNENSDVTLVLKGENKLDKSGIRVSESAKLTVEGDGVLHIRLDAAEYFGIGNDVSSGHGDLIFNQSGMVNISVSGRTGTCIGSGLGGNIKISQGKFILNVRGNTGVGIGSLEGDSKFDACNCSIDADLSLMNGVAIGSMTGKADVHMHKASTNLNVSGKDLAAIGTIGGDNTEVLINNAIMTLNVQGVRCTCFGSLDKGADCKLENVVLRAVVCGEQALPFGGLSGDKKVSLNNVDTTVNMETAVDMEKYMSADNIEIIDGRTNFTNHGNEIDMR